MRRLLLAALLLLNATSAMAGTLQPFGITSMDSIKARLDGRAFILALWSVSCEPCRKELGALSRQARRIGLPLVLVSTDSLQDADAIRELLRSAGLEHAEVWVFDDPVPERLRHAIDPAWHGELPRSYLYDAAHRREGVSGVIDAAMIERWRRTHQARR